MDIMFFMPDTRIHNTHTKTNTRNPGNRPYGIQENSYDAQRSVFLN